MTLTPDKVQCFMDRNELYIPFIDLVIQVNTKKLARALHPKEMTDILSSTIQAIWFTRINLAKDNPYDEMELNIRYQNNPYIFKETIQRGLVPYFLVNEIETLVQKKENTPHSRKLQSIDFRIAKHVNNLFKELLIDEK
jgi:hypothetical protein